MTLGEKIRYLREVEGSLRGLGRSITQREMLKAIKAETGKPISQSYLSQIESGKRRHMTQSTRTLLAKFFKVHPGFLVDDPPGYSRELQSELRTADATIDSWLYAGAEHFQGDSELASAIRTIAEVLDSRGALLLLGEILRTPGLAERLNEVLRPRIGSGHPPPANN